MHLRFCACLLFAAAALWGRDYYLDPAQGADGNPGTQARPLRTLAGIKPQAGDTVFLAPGNYGTARFEHSGTPEQPIRYQGVRETFFTGGEKDSAAKVLGSNLHFSGMSFGNGKHEVVLVSQAANVTFAGVHFSQGKIGLWPYLTRNLSVHDCDFEALEDGIFVDRCRNTSITGNRIGKDFRGGRDGITLYAQGNYITGSGPVSSVRILSPGKAMLENAGISTGRDRPPAGFHELRHGALNGDTTPSAVQLYTAFTRRSWGAQYQGQGLIAGGEYFFGDTRSWFRLLNHPDWDGKPYSPDGKYLLFDPDKASAEDLAGAAFAQIAYIFPEDYRTLDTRIEDNLIAGCGRQGIRTQRADYTLIRNNRILNCGATGIQLESGSRFTLVDNNDSHNHNRSYRNETGIWIHENSDAVVQNNRISGVQKGLALTQSYRCLVRFNCISDVRAQYVRESDRKFALANVNAFYMTGGSYGKCGVTPGCDRNAVVHNIFRDNGVQESHYGVFGFGFPDSPPIGRNLFLNNSISGSNAPLLLSFYYDSDIIFAGNRWPGDPTARVHCRDGQERPLAEWSQLEPPAPAPLARALADGRGRVIAVDNPEAFSAGFAFSDGQAVVPGDDITVGGLPARVTARDLAAGTLSLDRELQWSAGAPLQYQNLPQ
ncbi:MAG: DUF1565 domain-containing protein [Oligosphaeraceae bacterium]|nr:DUF1565 domain-containing protein [Oligosphaeraceae bacterium]